MITYAGKFYDIAEYNDTFVVHLRLSCKKSHKKCFFLIYITIVRIDENKAYRHGGLYTSGRGQLIIFFYHSNTNTNRVSDNQSYLWKKVFKYTKTLFFNCVLQNTAGHKGLKSIIKVFELISPGQRRRSKFLWIKLFLIFSGERGCIPLLHTISHQP